MSLVYTQNYNVYFFSYQGLPEAGSEVKFMVDLNGLCGLSSDNISGGRRGCGENDYEKECTQSTKRGDAVSQTKVEKGMSEREICSKENKSLRNDRDPPVTAVVATGVKTRVPSTSTIKRKRKTKRSFSSSSHDLVCGPPCPTSDSALLLKAVGGRSNSLEQHFNHLQIVNSEAVQYTCLHVHACMYIHLHVCTCV